MLIGMGYLPSFSVHIGVFQLIDKIYIRYIIIFYLILLHIIIWTFSPVGRAWDTPTAFLSMRYVT